MCLIGTRDLASLVMIHYVSNSKLGLIPLSQVSLDPLIPSLRKVSDVCSLTINS